MTIKQSLPNFEPPDESEHWVVWRLNTGTQKWERYTIVTDKEETISFMRYLEENMVHDWFKVTAHRTKAVEIFWPALIDEIEMEKREV